MKFDRSPHQISGPLATSGSFLGLLLLVFIFGCQSNGPDAKSGDATLNRHQGNIAAMGTQIRYVVYCHDHQLKAAEQLIADTLNELDAKLSDYKGDSEINKLAASAPHAEPVAVSLDLWRVCQIAQVVSLETDGAFDVTVGPISHLWRAAIKRNRLPDESKIETAKSGVGFDKLIVLPDRKIQLAAPNMQLDFGGIAKGYAADLILKKLLEVGIHQAMIDASGDISVMGLPPDAGGWVMEIPKQKGAFSVTLEIKKGGVATSGDAFQSLNIDGKNYSHVVDPRSGRAATRTSRATVIAPDGATADALASAFCVLDPKRAIEIAESLPDVEVYLLYRENETDERLQILRSSGFMFNVKSIALGATQ